jgi:hypothetical protein
MSWRRAGGGTNGCSGFVASVIAMADYEIRVVGGFPCEALAGLDQLTATPQPVHTVLSGRLNQSALKKLLTRLELLGTSVVEVRLLRSSASTATRTAGESPSTRA